MSGMMGLSPQIRVLHPTLAEQMQSGGPVRLPGDLTLRVAAYLGTSAQLTGPMLTGLTDGTGRAIHTLAAVSFKPLTWALATGNTDDLLALRGWIDATDGLLYEDDRESYDLRWLAPRGLPLVQSILHAPPNDGFQMYSSQIAPIMVGRIR
ncbi:MAG: hypothetical protein JWQ47_91 [Glaciihabitans sp.]|nr:hypothetical protein [Glaciihabitans sp.]